MSLVISDIIGLKEGLVDDLEGMARWVETNKLKLNAENAAVALSRNWRAQGVGACGARDGWPENRKEQVCEVSGSLLDDGLTTSQVQSVRKMLDWPS